MIIYQIRVYSFSIPHFSLLLYIVFAIIDHELIVNRFRYKFNRKILLKICMCIFENEVLLEATSIVVTLEAKEAVMAVKKMARITRFTMKKSNSIFFCYYCSNFNFAILLQLIFSVILLG